MSSPVLAREPGVRAHHVRLLGTGASTPTKELGRNITVTRPAAGRYLLTWHNTQNPGTFIGMQATLGAATPGDVKGHTTTRDTFTAQSGDTGASLEVSLWDSTFAADDLQATEYMDIVVWFKTVNV